MPNNQGGYPKPNKRKMPLEKMAERAQVMTRQDSLASMSEFGRIVPLSQQAGLRKKKKSINPFESIIKALGK